MIDLEDQFNFTNKLSHPTNPMKVVFRYFNHDQAEFFKELLADARISFEFQIDEEDERQPRYFGVSKSVERRADLLNYTALGRGRDKFIAAPAMRWIIIVISLALILLAVMGAWLS